jgi:hypothetical protein
MPAMSDLNLKSSFSTAVRRSRSGALWSSWVHIAPAVVSFGILQLSFRHVYWADVNAPNENAKLAGLQVVAKLHELLILLSMARLVLHYTRKLLFSSEGMPFGLLEAAYQTALSGQPWSAGFWETLKRLVRAPNIWRFWHIILLLVVSAFLSLFVGPASAVTVIPQLGYWYRQELVGPLDAAMTEYGAQLAPFSLYAPTPLFPKKITNSSLPGPFCGNFTQDVNGTCPSAGTLEVKRSFVPANLGQLQNFTASSSMNRKFVFMEGRDASAATIPNYVLASFTSAITASNYTETIPFTLEMLANGVAPLSPLVGARCVDNRSDAYVREYHYETDGSLDGTSAAAFDIRTVWNETYLANSINGTELAFKDVTGEDNVPVLIGLVRHQTNVTLCSMQAYWTVTKEWIASTATSELVTNFTWAPPDPSKKCKASLLSYEYRYARRYIKANTAKISHPNRSHRPV